MALVRAIRARNTATRFKSVGSAFTEGRAFISLFPVRVLCRKYYKAKDRNQAARFFDFFVLVFVFCCHG